VIDVLSDSRRHRPLASANAWLTYELTLVDGHFGFGHRFGPPVGCEPGAFNLSPSMHISAATPARNQYSYRRAGLFVHDKLAAPVHVCPLPAAIAISTRRPAGGFVSTDCSRQCRATATGCSELRRRRREGGRYHPRAASTEV
jgi:hypothetical protein